MKVSQELKDEFDRIKKGREATSVFSALYRVFYSKNERKNLFDFLFGNKDQDQIDKNQLQFAKWWAGEEEVEVEEELYYLKLPFEEGQEYIKLDPYDGKIYPSDKMERNRFQTKFTMKEIENNEKLRVLKECAKRVDDDV